MPTSTLRRASATAAAAAFAGLGVLAAAPAHAQSAELTYTCSLFVITEAIDLELLPDAAAEAITKAKEGDLSGLQDLEAIAGLAAADLPADLVEGLPVTAAFDSAIADGATTAVGSTVALSPLDAAITLPPETVAALTGISLDAALAAGVLYAGIDETETDRDAFFDFDEVAVEDGQISLLGTGDAESFTATQAGTHSYVGGDMDVLVGDPVGAFAVLQCTLDDGQDSTIDVITAKAAVPTPTPTPSPTQPAPVRPDVVQTDAAQPTSPTWLPLVGAGAGSILAVAGASHLLRRRAVASRG